MIEIKPLNTPQGSDWQFRVGRTTQRNEDPVYHEFGAQLSRLEVGPEHLRIFEEVPHRYGRADLVIAQSLDRGPEQITCVEVKPWLNNGTAGRNALAQAAAHKVGMTEDLNAFDAPAEEVVIHGILLAHGWERHYARLAASIGILLMQPVELATIIASGKLITAPSTLQ